MSCDVMSLVVDTTSFSTLFSLLSTSAMYIHDIFLLCVSVLDCV